MVDGFFWIFVFYIKGGRIEIWIVILFGFYKDLSSFCYLFIGYIF